MAEKTVAEVYFDQALDNHGMPPREDGQSLADYVKRAEFGPNTQGHLAGAVRAAEALNRQVVHDLVSSARQHHDDPNPPDAHPLKR